MRAPAIVPNRSTPARRRATSTAVAAAVAGVALLLGTTGGATEPRALHLASDTWPPFTGTGDPEGVAVQLVHTALTRAGLEARTSIVTWREVESGLRNGEFDGSAAMWRTRDRERELLFSAPYLENRLVLVGRKGSDVAATRLSDLAGRRVAAVGRYAYGPEIRAADGVLFVNGRNDQESLDRLLAGEVEYMLVDELVARYLLTYQREEAQAKLEIGSTPLARRSLHFVVRRDLPGAERIIDAFDAEIRAMLSDGSYAEVLQVAWILVDVDGDGLDELVPLSERVTPPAFGSVYDVFGREPAEPAEERRVFIQGSIFEGWDAVPERYKGPAGPDDVTFKHGTTLFTLQF